jgi:hypothetical protein
VAKTFDVSDPRQREDYLRESMAQMALYGGVHLEYGCGRNITVLDPSDLPPGPCQSGFVLAMDDGRVLPFPFPAVTP